MKSTSLTFAAILALTTVHGLAQSEEISETSAAVSATSATASLNDSHATLGQVALAQSVTPVRPGVPGKVPFWNGHAKRFIYAPAFDFRVLPNAKKYRFDITPQSASGLLTFEATTPYAPLSPIWAKVPVGMFSVRVTGLADDGTSVGVAGAGKYYRASPFNGPYHEPPAMPYDKSATLALNNLLHKDYVEYWFTHNEPDPSYDLYRYPSKIYSALVIGAVTQAHLTTGTEEAARSIKLARIVADYMLKIRFPSSSRWQYQVPTYYGPRMEKLKKTHMKVENHLTIMGVDAGNAFLDLYDITGDSKYFDAARQIADTYIKTQDQAGSWPLLVNYETGKSISDLVAIPTAIINYYDRLHRDYNLTAYEDSNRRALEWIMDNPVKTFEWHGQFEDISPRAPYVNQSREQACDLAIYLFKNKTNMDLAKELIRYAEDQFVIWEQPNPALRGKKKKGSGWDPATWITPSVQEQYVFWKPIGRSAGIMVDTYWNAYAATGDEIYLAKAKSLANSFPEVQKYHNGDYQTHFSTQDVHFWLNSVVYPAKILMNLDNSLKDSATHHSLN